MKMKKTLKFGALLLCLTSFFSSCDIINPAEDIPSYVNITGVSLSSNPATEGTSSHKITEAWLSVDGNFLGAYAIPSTFPILEEGEHEIAIQAGIKDNGITATPEIYPFFDPFTTTINLERDDVKEITPQFSYKDITKFAFIEDFEGAIHEFEDIRLGQSSQFELSTDDGFEGGTSAVISLDSSNFVFQAASTNRYNNLVNLSSTTVYLEVNYKSDVPVVFGVIGHRQGGVNSAGQALLSHGFLPSENWNKIYFNLSLLISQLNLDEYQVVFQAFIPSENGELTRSSGKVWLDNIKLVHF
ncbi:MAG: hypothetical protein MI974_11240 [Chitinophagales bacterium]|nr:hypothetical protein [Chitinophagales bacterium]